MNFITKDIFGKQLRIWGLPLQDAVSQMENCMKHDSCVGAALMGDHHVGYSVPIGGVIVYKDAISPSAVGFDIGCGNTAFIIDINTEDIRHDMDKIMDDVWKTISFGVGRKNKEEVIQNSFFDSGIWGDIPFLESLKDMARDQLGTVGSGNHYVDIFDCNGKVAIGVHFGSRGLGHKIASHYIKLGGGKDGMHVDPVVFSKGSSLYDEYYNSMNLAGEFARLGREWVCERVCKLLGGTPFFKVNNHHNFAWQETHNNDLVWVIRKGATPSFPNQFSFVGGTMAENSVILQGIDTEENKLGYYSTVHGAGRMISRTQAAGKSKWEKGKKIRVSEGIISKEMMQEWVVGKAGVILRGAGTDESPHCYKRLNEVLDAHKNTVRVINTLRPLGVAMAGEGEIDPYKD